jgi:MFS family permease
VFGQFRAVLCEPRVAAVALSSLVARLPKGMVPLATVLLLHQRTDSYALAGLTTALIALGDAASTPAQGRLVDRYGRGRVLLPTALVHAMAATVLIAARSPLVLTAAAVVAGVGMPPVSGSIKAVWSRLVRADLVTAAYALESLIQQLFFLSGPLLVTVLVAARGPALALGCSAGLTLTGTIGFVIMTVVVPAPAPVGHAGALRIPTVRRLLTANLLQSVAFGAGPVGLVALSAQAAMPGAAGPLQATLTIGGLIGTFAIAARGAYPRLLTVFATGLFPIPVLALWPGWLTLIGVGLASIGAGLLLTPIAALSYVLIQQATPPDCRTEAYAWLSTGLAIGSAAGSAMAGVLIDRAGPAAALGIGPVMIVFAAMISRSEKLSVPRR